MSGDWLSFDIITQMYQLFIVIAAMLWGLDGILRRQTYSLPATVVVFWEHVIGLAVLLIIWAFFKIRKKAPDWHIKGKDALVAIVIVGLLSGVVGTVAFTAALQQVQFIPLSVVFFVQKLQPVFTIIAARFILKEKPPFLFWMWALVALMASFFLTFPSGHINLGLPFEPHIVAASLAFVAAVAWGTSTVFSKIALKNNSQITITTYRFVFTILFGLPAIFFMGAQNQIFAVNPLQVAILFAIALSTGMVAVTIYYKGLQKVPAHISCILELVFPVMGLLIDMFVYKTSLAPSQLVAAAVLVFVIFQIVKLPKYAHQ